MRSAPTTPRGGGCSSSAASTPAASSSSATTPGTATTSSSSAASSRHNYYSHHLQTAGGGLLSPIHQRFIDIEARLRSWRITFKQLSSGGINNSKKASRRSASHDPEEEKGETPTRRRTSNKLLLLRSCEELDEESSRTCPVPRKRLHMNLQGLSRPRPRLELDAVSSNDSLSPEEVLNRFQLIQAKSGQLNIGGQVFKVELKDLQRMGQDAQLGTGASGSVCKYKFRSRPIAVKQMKRTDSVDESKRIFMDLEVISKCKDCRYIVNYYGYIITFDYLYICMELMCTCLDKLLIRRRADPSRGPDEVGLPEEIIGHIALSVLRALDYLKETHKIMHRDVKPSNILLDWFGNIKLCDFGISGKLIESKASTRTGCTGYLAPERINIDSGASCPYDVRADVWSLGITLVQLATGRFPYECVTNALELMITIHNHEPPRLEPNQDGLQFSVEFCQFVSDCLQKDMNRRPKFKELLEKPFLQRAVMFEQNGDVDVALWCASQQGDSEDAITARAQYEAQYGGRS
uniref:mitogen-activated protein kinase kinase n=1 Tax=Globodera rostochiensis TaxID=31243 RepID=A0A914IH49_GLORO